VHCWISHSQIPRFMYSKYIDEDLWGLVTVAKLRTFFESGLSPMHVDVQFVDMQWFAIELN
jgi:hypothetical protein